MKIILTISLIVTVAFTKLVFKTGSSTTSNGFTLDPRDSIALVKDGDCKVDTPRVSFMATPAAITINEA